MKSGNYSGLSSRDSGKRPREEFEKAGSNLTFELLQKAALLRISQILRRVLDSD